jgi:hypothetical protein
MPRPTDVSRRRECRYYFSTRYTLQLVKNHWLRFAVFPLTVRTPSPAPQALTTILPVFLASFGNLHFFRRPLFYSGGLTRREAACPASAANRRSFGSNFKRRSNSPRGRLVVPWRQNLGHTRSCRQHAVFPPRVSPESFSGLTAFFSPSQKTAANIS